MNEFLYEKNDIRNHTISTDYSEEIRFEESQNYGINQLFQMNFVSHYKNQSSFSFVDKSVAKKSDSEISENPVFEVSCFETAWYPIFEMDLEPSLEPK